MEYKIQNRKSIGFTLKEIIHYRELFVIFAWRDLRLKYRQTFLGFAWVVLQPIIMMIIFTVIFSHRINISSSELPYPVFVFAGLIIWGIFSQGITTSSNSLITQAHVIKKTYFPRIILPVSSILVSAVDFLASILLLIPLLIIVPSQVHIPRLLVYMLCAFFLAMIPTIGIGILLAGLNVRYRDVKFVVPFFLQIMLFISPVIYPMDISAVKGFHWIMQLNPLSGAIEMMRAAVSLHTGPDWIVVVTGLGVSVLIMAFSLFIFGRMQKNFADIA